jgi:Tfp pilus assembly PilM family ATPase
MIKKPITSSRSRKRFVELVGIDFSTTATKVVRLKKGKSELSLVGIDELPAIEFGSSAPKVELPRNINANYGCLTYSGLSSVVRMVNAPVASEDQSLDETKLRGMLNVEDDFRVSSMLVNRGSGRLDSSFLAAAVPQSDIDFLLDMFSVGTPAPASVEVAGLSFVPAFLNARWAEVEKESVCLLDAGESVSHFVFLNKGTIGLVGKLSFGVRSIREKLAEDLGVDDELADSILSDRSINISSSLRSVMEPYLKQLSISMDFLQRHQGCRVTKVYVSGGLSLVPSWSAEVEQIMNAKVLHWSPLENIQCDSDLLTDELKAQATRFSAAIGAAIGGFDEA